MTWPTTPIPTANLDQQTDNPGLARADLLQMANQVNAIQDTFTLTSPQNGDFLVYSTSTDSFENKTQVSQLGHLPRVAVLNWTASATQVTVDGVPRFRLVASEAQDPDNLITVNADGSFTLSTGTYVFLNSGYRIGLGISEPRSIGWYVGSTQNLIKDMPAPVTGAGQTAGTMTPDYYLFRQGATSETHIWLSDSSSVVPYYAPLIIVRLL
jgi:hypothetical protein